jgi:DNA-binding response OmpR family regulator
MATILAISSTSDNPLPTLEILGHQILSIGFDPQALSSVPRHDITLLDCREDLSGARAMARILSAAGWHRPILLLVNEAALAAISTDWGLQDFVMVDSSIAEVAARIRLLLDAHQMQKANNQSQTGLVIDELSYVAKVNGRTLDLTFKEFELLRHLNENPDRVFSREQLLSEVWGYDYFGGTRTVDVHIRRLRAKLGEFEGLIGTVRNVGYLLNPKGSHQD